MVCFKISIVEISRNAHRAHMYHAQYVFVFSPQKKQQKTGWLLAILHPFFLFPEEVSVQHFVYFLFYFSS